MIDIPGIGVNRSRSEKARAKKRSGSASSDSHFAESVQDFSGALDAAEQSLLEADLEKFVARITEQGERLKRHPNRREFLHYKAQVAAFLRRILEQGTRVEHELLPSIGREYVTLRIIDERLVALGHYLLLEQVDTLAVAATIDEIRGLVFDSFTLVCGKDSP